MLHGVTRTSAALFLLAGFGLTPAAAAPVSVTGSAAVAVAGVIAPYSPLLSLLASIKTDLFLRRVLPLPSILPDMHMQICF